MVVVAALYNTQGYWTGGSNGDKVEGSCKIVVDYLSIVSDTRSNESLIVDNALQRDPKGNPLARS